MYYIVRYEGEEVGAVMSNQSLTTDRVLALAGIDIEEMDGSDPRWDYNLFEIETVSDDEYNATHSR